MDEKNKIQLGMSSILNVPFASFVKDFTFEVNKKEFITSRIVADLLSPKICCMHLIDPTINKFVIETQVEGNFSKILNLISFQQNEIEEEEVPFVLEVIEILGNETIKLNEPIIEITLENVFQLLQIHEKFINVFSKKYQSEVDFISSHFFEICENYIHEFSKLHINTLISIVDNKNLQLVDEDQLLRFINQLYQINNSFSDLYEHVNFVLINPNVIKEFMQIYDPSEMKKELWIKLSQRMNHDVTLNDDEKELMVKRHRNIIVGFDKKKPFSGIFDYFQKKTNGKIKDEIKFSYSQTYRPDLYKAINVLYNDDPNIVFISDNIPNSWICFEYKNCFIIPTHYTIKSRNGGSSYMHPINWVIEGSKDNNTWIIIDSQNNCQFLNGPSIVHTFDIDENDFGMFKYIRMRQTGPNSHGTHYLALKSFELYGKII